MTLDHLERRISQKRRVISPNSVRRSPSERTTVMYLIHSPAGYRLPESQETHQEMS